MRWLQFFLAAVLFAGPLVAQQIPPGTTLPVMLNSALDARKDKPGQQISARIMQDVPLPDGARIPARSRVLGHIVEVDAPALSHNSRLVLQFDQLLLHGRRVPIITNLRAIASMMDVYDAQMPTNAWDEYGTSVADWNTLQVGGDIVYRGSGEVIAADQVVARSNSAGDVTGKLTSVPAQGCRGATGSNDHPQALWVFSTSACGAYGFFPDLKIEHAGRTPPIGQIVLQSAGNLLVRAGSGLLLRVQ